MKDQLRIASWNVEWRKPTSRDAEEIRQRLLWFDPDIVCLTESWVEMLSEWGGYTITSRLRPDKADSQRSVLLWSRTPWTEPDDLGHEGLSRQCFVSGKTATSIGELQVAGLIIPYHMADVSHGTRVRRMWEQHEIFLDHLPMAIAGLGGNSVVLGDFNQRMPSTWVPERLQQKLRRALSAYNIVTAEGVWEASGLPIDHIALGSALDGECGPTLSNQRSNGRQLSDHFGVTAIARWAGRP